MKKFASLLLCLALALSLGSAALAAGGVSYAGQAENFIFTPGSEQSPTDLFEGFKDLMPGDSLTEQITVKNLRTDNTEVRIYLRSLGEAEGSTAEFLRQLTLTVTQDGKELFRTGEDVQADGTGGLTERVLLGSFGPGEEVTLELTLTAPIDMGNDFANAVGYIDWEFTVEEIPAPKAPAKTGDDSPIVLYGAVVLLCAAALTVLVLQKKKRG